MARRLAAILAADVVGYSRLMAADEKGTHARLKTLRQDFIEPKIAEHQGRVVKLMGDGALVEFASVVHAVECASAIQKVVAERQADVPEAERIAFRIGINVGDVIIDGDDIYGDGVNIAARLESLRRAGRHLCDRRCARAGARQARCRIFRSGRADGQEHRSAATRLSSGGRPEIAVAERPPKLAIA